MRENCVGFMLCIYIIFMPLIPNNFNIKGIGIRGDYLLLIIFLVYMIKLIIDRKTRMSFYEGIVGSFRDPISIFMMLLFIVMIISISYSPNKSIAISESIRFLTYIITYFIIKYEIKTDILVNRILNSYVIATFLISVFGIVQYFTKIGLDKKFIYDTSKYSVALRITSTLDNSNTLGAYLIIAVFPLIMISIYEKNIVKKSMYIITTLLSIITIVLTFSRNAWLAFLLGIFILIVVYNWRFILFLIFGLGLSMFIPQIRSRAMDFRLVLKDPRVNLWKLAIKMIKEHPLLGVGNGNYYDQYAEYIKKYPKLQYNSYTHFLTHNSFLKVGSELGLIGIVPFIGFLVSILIKLKTLLNNLGDNLYKFFYRGFYISVIVFLLMNMSDNLFFVPKVTMYFWILVAISQSILYNKISTRRIF